MTAVRNAAKAHHIGPHSRVPTLAKLDRRTRESRYLAKVRAALIADLGGPSRITAPQAFLIQRVAVDLMRLEMLDARIADGSLTEHDGRVAHALRTSVRLALRDLGLHSTQHATPSLADLLALDAAE